MICNELGGGKRRDNESTCTSCLYSELPRLKLLSFLRTVAMFAQCLLLLVGLTTPGLRGEVLVAVRRAQDLAIGVYGPVTSRSQLIAAMAAPWAAALWLPGARWPSNWTCARTSSPV